MPVFNKMIYDGTEYILGGGSNVGEPTNLSASATSGTSVDIKWTDNNLQALPPSTFGKSVLVRKVGSAPITPSDGTTVVTETVMNTYQSSAYSDTGLTDGTTYYYQVFSYSTDGGITYGTSVSVTPQSGWQPDASRTIFYYDFEQNLNDDSGNSHNVTSSADISYVQVGGQYVVIGTGGDMNCQVNPAWSAGIGTGDFAISFMIYPKTTTGHPCMFGIWNDSSPYEGPNIFFDIQGASGAGVSDKIVFRMRGGGSEYHHYGNTVASSLYDSWHHIVMTRNSGTISCYIDGVLETSWSDNTSFPTSNYKGYLIGRGDYPPQARGVSGVQADKYILENVGWDATAVSNYFNSIKSIYGIS